MNVHVLIFVVLFFCCPLERTDNMFQKLSCGQVFLCYQIDSHGILPYMLASFSFFVGRKGVCVCVLLVHLIDDACDSYLRGPLIEEFFVILHKESCETWTLVIATIV